jgi:hypothetical protein
MSKDQEKLSAEAILNGLAKVLAESELSGEERESDIEEVNFLSRSMEVINNWRRELKFEKARKKSEKFQEFWNSIYGLSSLDEIIRKIVDTLQPNNPTQKLVFHRKLEKITKEDIESLKNEEYLLELWSEFYEETEDE